MMADDDKEYFFLGTPLREEEESRAGQRRKEVQDPAAVRQLPLWKQARPALAPHAAERSRAEMRVTPSRRCAA